VVEIGVLVAKLVDAYVHETEPTYPEARLADIIEKSICAKGRLLHYFAMNDEQDLQRNEDTSFSDWCGWHNDHGSLTGLVPAMFLDAEGQEIPNPDPEAGLYIRARSGDVVKAAVPAGTEEYLLFQIGETAQVHSGGVVQATPHAVRGVNRLGVSRETFAVFMEPGWDEPMDPPPGRRPEDAQTSLAAESLPQGVPTLASRWQPGIDFGKFTDNSLSAYY